MKYVIETACTTVYRVIVDASSKDEAMDLVYEGDYDDIYNEPVEHINEEIIHVWELKENDN